MEKWLELVIEIQSIAQAGLEYTENVYDRERYERLRELSAEMINLKSDIPVEKVRKIFCNENGYQTPKLDTRAAIFKDGKILLVHEKNGTWAMPGGWCDVLQSIRSNTIKEVKEESGLDAIPKKLIAMHDKKQRNKRVDPYAITTAYVLCDAIGGSFKENSETTEIGYFSLDELPVLAEEKNTKEQIAMCFEAAKNENWETQFD